MSEEKSTTETGNAFRDSVCDLLRTRYPGLRIEKRAAGTKVDIRFVHDDFGRSQIWAVECKDYSKPLEKSYVTTQIYPQYNVMQANREVDRVLIVSRKGVSTDAQDFIDAWPGASHQTYEQLAETLVGLKGFVQSLASLRPTEAHQYVEARLQDVPGSALDAIESWVRDDHGGPSRAILGGYGQGKSSLARRAAAHFASRYLADPTRRMPILLRLGDVVHETQLEGLFGKEFTARHNCPGYQFPTLEHLNRSGRLLIILDGFDEMKHAMTAADFQSNFAQFNRLLVGKAKVLLLGRPNALPSNERELVFRGQERVGEQQVASTTFARWPEWRMAFFDEVETRELLASCLTVFQQQHAGDGRFAYPSGFVAMRIEEILAKVPGELLRRPVHVQLLAGLAADPNFDLDGFNEHRLYEHFIREMVQRDTRDKPARRLISLEARLKFQRELAWWAWRRPEGQGHFLRQEVPASILQDLPNGNAIDGDGKRNEYIVSTLTEEKESGVLFFAHRSFQEFLVAERMRLVAPTPAAHAEYSKFMTADVEAFLRQAPDPSFIVDWYKTLQGASGPIALPYLPFFASFPLAVSYIREARLPDPVRDIDPWTVLILHHASRLGTTHALAPADWHAFTLELVKGGKSETATVAALALLDEIEEGGTISAPGLHQLTAAILERTLLAARGDSNSGKLTIDKVNADFASEWIATVGKRPARAGRLPQETELTVNVNLLEQFCCAHLQGKGGKALGALEPVNPIRMANAPTSDAEMWGDLAVPSSQVYRYINPELSKAHSMFLRGRLPFSVVPVDVRRGANRR
jgi:hypothetical protein